MQLDRLIGNDMVDLVDLFHIFLMQPPEGSFDLVAPESTSLVLRQTIIVLAQSSTLTNNFSRMT